MVIKSQITKDENGGTGSMHEIREMHTTFQSKILRETDLLKDPGVKGTVT